MATKCPLVPLNKDQFKDLCKEINLKPEQLEKDVKTLAAWIELQPHLPQDAFDEMMLGAFITSGKNSLEIAKQKIDMYLTNRLSCPELYGNRDPYAEDIMQNEKVSGLFTLLQTTSEGYRVNMNTIIDTNPDNYNYIAHIKRFLNLFDVRFKSEKYLRGDYFVFDLKGVSLMHITKCTPSLSKKFVHCIKVL
uniref:CRAL/TRIO N-terminal domain-containing protein n=1 Tax=Clastoptera arizonana TaxID=38151 RepID=A0A1B6CKR0_9HEMI